jgi:hypothetical protein
MAFYASGKTVPELNEATSANADELMLIHDGSTGLKKITIKNLRNAITEDTDATLEEVKDSIHNPTVTINQAGTKKGSFTLNQSGDVTIDLTDNNTTYSAATTSANGLMSSTDKKKLDGVAEGANKYVHPTTSGNKHIPSGGSSGQILRWSADGTAAWGADNNTTYNAATTSAAGLMSAADKTKLDGVATGANNYTHPTTSGNKHIPSGGSSGQILRWSADGTAAWGSDNNTTYSAATTSAAGLMSAADKANLDDIVNVLADNAGAHNSIFRGKSLGSSVTDAQWAAIKAGTFVDLYVGDYWTINSVNWRIAGFDYYLYNGDTSTTAHHAVIVPDTSLYSAQMNETNTTEGGYVGSLMFTTNLETAKTTVNNAFGSAHILSHRVYLVNAVSSGRPSGGAWTSVTVDLMNEQMVYGGLIFGWANAGTIPTNYRVDKSQLPLFALAPEYIQKQRSWYWLRDVVSAAGFADVDNHGLATCSGASYAGGVRPAFLIYQS